ncbi:hypothetical protein ACET3Z_018671 [Daucus carota]
MCVLFTRKKPFQSDVIEEGASHINNVPKKFSSLRENTSKRKNEYYSYASSLSWTTQEEFASWDNRLDAYIHNYLVKRRYNATSRIVQAKAAVPCNNTDPIRLLCRRSIP